MSEHYTDEEKQYQILPLISYIATDVTNDFLNQMANQQ